ncbi:aminoglycoside phosphotransferase family protein [Micromonospora mirobrigensis]|uniref:Streptomycin 6-kinase n=1 Tax=Micromonospora mirobrigensis TaxID=262898 RepID=A0A1C5AFS1_9ACTN|nr:aminoglycoside phosphotransferase family protein [Micromonospora mirobrigensis]SCF44077.1 streptomycin 6-kinase [Micromonospora mirobrigensis]
MTGARPVVTDALARHVVGVWGGDGERWLAELPTVLADLARDWGLDLGEPYELSYHYVTAATLADGTPAVLKLGVPTGTSLAEEAPALAAFTGRGAVRLLRADLDRGALLLERAVPGGRLRDLVPDRDAEATSALAGVIRRLHVPPPPDCRLPEASAQARAFDRYLARHGTAGPLPHDLVARAGGLMRELCASAPARVVLHGDLHHDNVLRATREPWLAIDPHGLVGDPGYEVGALLYNPTPEDRSAALTGLVPARVEQLADELPMPVERVVAWGFVKAVLSDVWSAEEWSPAQGRSPVSRALDVARLLLPRLS